MKKLYEGKTKNVFELENGFVETSEQEEYIQKSGITESCRRWDCSMKVCMEWACEGNLNGIVSVGVVSRALPPPMANIMSAACTSGRDSRAATFS